MSWILKEVLSGSHISTKSSYKAPATLITPMGLGKGSIMFQNLKFHGSQRYLSGKTWRKEMVPACGSRIVGVGTTDPSISYNSWYDLCSPVQTWGQFFLHLIPASPQQQNALLEAVLRAKPYSYLHELLWLGLLLHPRS